jgi:hypothetical protein
MEEAPENGKESSQSGRSNEMNEMTVYSYKQGKHYLYNENLQ